MTIRDEAVDILSCKTRVLDGVRTGLQIKANGGSVKDAALGRITAAGDYPVYGRPNEIGQIYTSITGLLNLLCIVNAVYWAHLRRTEHAGE